MMSERGPCELDSDGIDALAQEIMSLGYSEEIAADYAVLIGDTPIEDEIGRTIVMERGQEIARLPLKFFDEPRDGSLIIDGDQRQCAVTALMFQYGVRFGNFDEISLPEFLFDVRFHDLLDRALKRGRPLTQEEVTKVFPSAAWEY